MRVELKSLKPNPFRNFKVDPIDPDVVKALKESIKDNPGGFWGGIVARKSGTAIELCFGHHRVKAAQEAGIREDDIKVVSNISDAEMIRMYANENATQRGNTGTAIAGTVASAVQFLLKGMFSGNFAGFPAKSQRGMESSLGRAAANSGLGHVIIEEFLADIPGVNENTIKQQLANLKASGDYDEIVELVKAEVEAEQKEKLKELARLEAEQQRAKEALHLAEKRAAAEEERRKEAAKAARAAKEDAAQKRAAREQADAEYERVKAEKEKELAAKRKAEAEEQMKKFDALRRGRDAMNGAAGVEREITFDFEAVAQHLKNASHIDVFRNLATGEGAREFLPVPRQGALAKALVKLAKDQDTELSGRFIRENFMSLLSGARGTSKKLDAEDRAELLRKDWSLKMKTYQDDFSRHARGVLTAAVDISSTAKSRPTGVTLHLTSEFRNAVQNLKRAVALIEKAGVR